mmetsp:Transcript_21385/g.46436  ORF Transcript_21385/g.46436 Transcript_21385/m.46436 type:complete len:342 (+) Transcript_21385:335-1360(+)|eukprot:CAMPEP_0172319932 /NCGR_PEP_ID=MMETSP1058-20130122/39101_1 /TAXON_ID=83371 /ORGANISM="Detonula confervacea, Strain CCMP 353" /LENGTH=341 /DNA_ID=CAMNT_0013035081 /DNA_START=253 /DNA_END=1278 /DNA_ORIENTATION=+
MSETLEEITSRHKKELKSFEGEKRGAFKTAKSRGKKGKGAVKEAEFKYQGLERDLKERHRMELEQITSGGGADDDGGAGTQEEDVDAAGENADAGEEETTSTQPTTLSEEPTPEQIEQAKRQIAIEKKLKKKNAQRQKEIGRESRIKEENAMAGPSRRQMEMEALQMLYLTPRGLDVQEVEADGNCLYRAVGVQCRRLGLDAVDINGEGCYGKMRSICADVLMGSNRAEYEPFAECGEGHASDGDGGNHPATFEEYVKNVRSTSTWGGQLELRALSEGLKCPIVVFSADGTPLTMGAEYAAGGKEEDGSDDNGWDKKKALLLSFHRHYYALGEHYNSVIPK